MAWSRILIQARDAHSDPYPYVAGELSQIAQVGASVGQVLMRLSRTLEVQGASFGPTTLVLTHGGESYSVPIPGKAAPDQGHWAQETFTADFSLPASWIGVEVSWTMRGVSGKFTFDSDTSGQKVYAQIALELQGTGPVALTRTSSPRAAAATGTIPPTSPIYTADVIKIETNRGYKLVVNGAEFVSGNSLVATAAVLIVVSPQATLHLYEESEWVPYLLNIFTGQKWELHQAYVYNGSAWEPYF